MNVKNVDIWQKIHNVMIFKEKAFSINSNELQAMRTLGMLQV